MINKIFILTLFIILDSCSHMSSSKDGSVEIFPKGIYHQLIKIEIKKNNQYFQFDGLLKKEDQQLTIVGFSPFGPTLFKALSRSNNHHLEIYSDELKNYEQQILKIFDSIINLLSLGKDDLDKQSHLSVGYGRYHLDITFQKFDPLLGKTGIFKQMIIQHQFFTVSVEILNYEVL